MNGISNTNRGPWEDNGIYKGILDTIYNPEGKKEYFIFLNSFFFKIRITKMFFKKDEIIRNILKNYGYVKKSIIWKILKKVRLYFK